MKDLLARTLYRVLISLVLFVGFVLVGIAIPLDIAVTTALCLWTGIRLAYDNVVEDMKSNYGEAKRVLRAFVEAFRRGRM